MIRHVPIVLVLAASLGCRTIQPVASPSSFITARQPDRIWVTNERNLIVQIGRPHLVGDSVVGLWIDVDQEVRLPLSLARAVHAKQFNGTRTVLLAGGIAVVSSGIVYMLFQLTGDPVPCNNPPKDGLGCN